MCRGIKGGRKHDCTNVARSRAAKRSKYDAEGADI